MNNNEHKTNDFKNSEEVSDKPLSDDELSSLIKASKESTFNEIELRVKQDEVESFKKVTLHDIAKQEKKDIKEDNLNKKLNNTKDNTETKNNTQIDNTEEIENVIDNVQSNENKIEENDADNKKEIGENDSSKKHQETEVENKPIDSNEHLRILEEEKNIAYEKGKNDAYNEIKEGSDAAIAQLKKITESISKVEELDLKNFEDIVEKKVLELASDLAGNTIKDIPSAFIKKIKNLMSQLENIQGNISIYLNEEDLKSLESNKDIKKEIKNLNLYSSNDLGNGQIELKVNGITVRNVMK